MKKYIFHLICFFIYQSGAYSAEAIKLSINGEVYTCTKETENNVGNLCECIIGGNGSYYFSIFKLGKPIITKSDYSFGTREEALQNCKEATIVSPKCYEKSNKN